MSTSWHAHYHVTRIMAKSEWVNNGTLVLLHCMQQQAVSDVLWIGASLDNQMDIQTNDWWTSVKRCWLVECLIMTTSAEIIIIFVAFLWFGLTVYLYIHWDDGSRQIHWVKPIHHSLRQSMDTWSQSLLNMQISGIPFEWLSRSTIYLSLSSSFITTYKVISSES